MNLKVAGIVRDSFVCQSSGVAMVPWAMMIVGRYWW